MLQGRLTTLAGVALAAAAISAAAACSGDDSLSEAVVEPGITAIEQASGLACSTDSATLTTALAQYEMLEGAPAADEAALVEAGYLRTESDLFDVDAGTIVAVDPACAAATTAGSATDIVTSRTVAGDVETYLDNFTDAQVAALGGPACARQLAVVYAGADRFIVDHGVGPASLAELADGGYLAEPITMWEVTADALTPVAGMGCVDLAAVAGAAPGPASGGTGTDTAPAGG